ncbi:MAG: phage portal protein [Lactobacillus crispatus]|nr:phage portal protein [Lactobacillus crispatus]
MEKRGIDYLKQKLALFRSGAQKKYDYYDMNAILVNNSILMPEKLRGRYEAVIGWCTKAVDALADRLVFREFDNDIFDLNEIFEVNSSDIFFDSAILSALITSCCFVYVSLDNDGIPKLQVIEGTDATGVIDPITGLLTEGYAVLDRDKLSQATLEAYFEPGKTYYYKQNQLVKVVETNAPYASLIPIIHRPDAKRPFGRSRITKGCQYFQNLARKTLERSDISAEFYSFPQKYATGVSQDAETFDNWKATIASLLVFQKDENGDSPHLGSFPQQSMTPYLEQLRSCASGFAGESGLTLDDLGFPSDNPSSAEAIKASHETLRVTARKAQRCFGSGFLNVGYIACCMRDEFPYRRSQFYKTKPKWEPVFEADATTMSLVGDGAIKINQAVPGYMDKNVIRDLTGLEGADGTGYNSQTVGIDSKDILGESQANNEGQKL